MISHPDVYYPINLELRNANIKLINVIFEMIITSRNNNCISDDNNKLLLCKIIDYT